MKRIIKKILNSPPEMGNEPSSEHLPPTPPPRPSYVGTEPVRRDLDFYSELCHAVQAKGEKIDSAQPKDTSVPKKKKSIPNLSMPFGLKKLRNEKKTSESVFYDDSPNNTVLKPERKVALMPPPRRLTNRNIQPDEGPRPDDHHTDVVPDPEIVPDTLTDDQEDSLNLYDTLLDSVSTDEDEDEDEDEDIMDADDEREDHPLRNPQILVPEPMEKRYDLLDKTLKFVTRQDEIDPFSSEDGDGSLRAEMSCGHAVTPESLTEWCRSLLEQGEFIFRCPAVVEGTKVCNKEWSYQEVRRLADLSTEEMEYFESTLARLAASQYCDIKPCPKCKTSVERVDISNLCVCCTICTADLGKVYQFCWQCLEDWKGPSLQPERCNNDGCFNKVLQLLQTCRSISLPEVRGVTDCPSVRACPTCGIIVEHSRDYCKNINCPRCHVEFCFVCLKLKRECNITSSPYDMCEAGVAPRQTSVPVWKRT